MQLLVLILKKVDLMERLIRELAEAGVSGGTILEGTGMAQALINMEELPMFGVLRSMLTSDEKEACKLMLFVLKDEQVMDTRNCLLYTSIMMVSYPKRNLLTEIISGRPWKNPRLQAMRRSKGYWTRRTALRA